MATNNKAATPAIPAPDPFDMVEVTLPYIGEEQEAEFISVNDKTYSATLGVPVRVPRCVADALVDRRQQQEATRKADRERANRHQ